ncbi:MAG: autotransporter outer membrane beta-barrel domain-containing protein [Phenylobacterium sp.]|nr:autotransporter outer membrane beta-barrel domain-containing protein [Phenylobacterium sp.]
MRMTARTSKTRLWLAGVSTLAMAGLAATPALADGGRGAPTSLTAGGAGGVDGAGALAAGQDGLTIASASNGTGGGGGAVDLSTGNGAHGGSRGVGGIGTGAGALLGAYGATGATGAVAAAATTYSAAVAGGAGGAGQPAVNNVNTTGGGGGGGAGVSATADIVVAGTGVVTGGAGFAQVNAGGGGGGVGVFSSARVTVNSGGRITGGAGGGSAQTLGGGGGGMGVALRSGGALINNGVVLGGAGGATGLIGGGGGGGAGVLLINGGTVTNAPGASITGGVGGAGRFNATGPTSGGLGGAGVKGANINLVNAGIIAGAMGGTTSGGGAAAVRAAAVQFTGGINSLEIRSGAIFTGDVIAFSTADTLKLGGIDNASFDVAALGGAFRGFGQYEKVERGVWTLTGTTTAVTPWTVRDGLLEVSTDQALGDVSGRLTLAGGGVRMAGSFETARAVTLANAGSVIDVQGSFVTFSGLVSGAGGLDKRGSNTLVLNGDNTYAGATRITGGTLQINGDQSAATGLTTVGPGGWLAGSGTVGGDVVVEDEGAISPGNSPGTLTIAGDLSLTDPLSVLDMEFGQSGVVGGPMNDLIKVGGDLRLDGKVDITVTAGGVFDLGLYRIISYGGTLDDQGLTVNLTPAGSTVSVQTAIAGQVNLVNTTGATVNFWDGADQAGNGRIDGGAGTWTTAPTNWTTATGGLNSVYSPANFLIFAAAPGAVTVGAVSLASGGGLQFAVNGYRLNGGAITLATGGHVFRVGDGTADGKDYVATIDTPITGANGAVTKTDLGTLILNGANTYTGITTVSAGTLMLNGSVAGGGSALVVQANGTFGGTGTSRGGAVSGTLAPGGLTNPGTLTFNGNLLINPSAVLRYRLGQAGTAGGALNDLTVVNGNLTLDGTLNVAQSPGGSFGAGLYRLINYTGSLTDNGLDVGTLPTSYTGVVQTAVAGQVNLLVAGGPAPGGGGGGGGGGTVTPPPPPPEFTFWDGDRGAAGDGAISGGDGVWRADSGNWTTASGAQNGAFSDPRFAIFAGTGGTVRLDASGGAIEVGGAQFAADGYALSGDALNLAAGDNVIRVGDGTSAGAQFRASLDVVVAGTGGLTKTDAGTLILTGENTYAGGTRVEAGALQIGAGGTSGSILGDVSVAGALAFDRSDEVAFGGTISGAGLLAQAGAGTLTLIADSSGFTGRAEVQAGELSVDGVLGGGVSVLGGARLSGTGAVGDLTNLAGAVVAPGGGEVGALGVRGDYFGEGGSLELQVELGGDASAADRLAVRGATHGETLVHVLRTGGTGVATVNGIRLVEVGGASDGVFTLADPDYVIEGRRALVAGAYGYVLAKDDGGWSLRSSLPAQATEPTVPVTPATTEVTLYQPGVPLYEALPRVLSALNGVGTLAQRTGDRQWSGEEGASVWGRLEASGLHAEPKSSASLSGLDVDSWRLQFGAERTLGEGLAGGQLVAGLTAHYGQGSAEVDSRFGGGDVDAKAYGVGATLTWYGAGGGYVDAQAQASWFDSDLKSDLLGRRADGVGGQGYGASVEAGRAFAAGEGLSLTPQAQLTYSSIDFDSFVDPLQAAVSSGDGDSLRARAGLALDHQRTWQDAGGEARSLRLYGVANLAYEFLDGTSARVAGVSVGGQDERLWGGLVLGGGYDVGAWSVFGEVAADTSLSGFGDSYGYTGSAGFKLRF